MRREGSSRFERFALRFLDSRIRGNNGRFGVLVDWRPRTDIDDDGVPNESDACYCTPAGVTVDPEGRPVGDIDPDCDTDLLDFGLFQQGFTGPR